MPDPKIVQYIKTQLALGATKESILGAMKVGGWPLDNLEESFNEASKDFKKIKSSESYAAPEPTTPSKFIPYLKGIGGIALVAIICFVTFSIMYNAVIRGALPADDGTSVAESPEPGELANGTSTINYHPTFANAIQIAPTTAVFVSSPTVSADEKNQVSVALLTLKSVLGSGYPTGIRNYLEVGSLPADAATFAAMSDAQILSYAQAAFPTFNAVTSTALLSAQTTWTEIDSATIQVSIPTASGPVVKTSHEIGGSWY